MISLDHFVGISGLQWAVLLKTDGGIDYIGTVPGQSVQFIAAVQQAINNLHLGPAGADLDFAGGKVLVRTTPEGYLILFCEDNIHVSLIDLVLGRDLGADSQDASHNTAIKSSGQLTSGVQTFDLSGRAVPVEVLDELLDIYAEFLGPLARKLARKDAKRAGLDMDKVPVKAWSRLLNTLAARIDAEDKRESFLDRAVMLKTKFEEFRS